MVTLDNFLSIGALLISGYSLYLSNQNKKEQQNLQKEMQSNELKFSRRKVWYDKQNEVLDTSLAKLIEISTNFNTFKILVEKELNDKNNFTIHDREKLIEILELIQSNNNYISAHEHYFPKSLENNIDAIVNSTGHLLIKLDSEIDENNRAHEEEINKHMSSISSNIKEITNEIRNMFLE